MPSISKRTKPCFVCGKEGKYGVFKRYYCEECYAKRPHRGHGSGGMIALSEEELQYELNTDRPFHSKPYFLKVPKGHKVFASLFLSHYPESKGIVGRSINYLILYKNRIVGIIGLMNPPYAIELVDNYFGINKDNRNAKNLEIANNHVFRLVSNEPNLASRCLRLLRKVGVKDWQYKYGVVLKGLLTFVEPPRNGICYLADNWKYLGMTKGFGTTQRSNRWENRKWVKKSKKHIFVIKLVVGVQ